MKTRQIITISSIGVIIGSIAGFATSLYYIVSNRYIQYRMFRLVAFTFQKMLNNSILFFVIGILVLYIIWYLFTEKMGYDKNKVMQFQLIMIVVLIVFLSINRLLKRFTIYTSIFTLRHFVTRTEYFIKGMISLDYILSLLGEYLAPAIILVITIVAMPFLYWLFAKAMLRKLKRIDGEKILKSIRIKYIGRTAFVLVILLVILNLWTAIDGKMNISEGPNIILIICDALRADHLGCYGYYRNTTENIDLLADEAAIFVNAYTQAPATVPSMWNIMTSKYQSAIPAKNGYVTVAEYFKSKNYNTAAFIAQHHLEGTVPNLHQGFGLYDSKFRKDKHGLPIRKAESITNAAIKWIKQNRKHPFFIWLVYFDPHDPYDPPDKFKGYYNKKETFNRDRRAEGIAGKLEVKNLISKEHRQFLINAYDEEIRYFDYELGRLFSYLKELKKYENSIIILTADHGEELGDNENRWDHCQILSQEEIRVPLLIKMPGQKKKIIINEAVQTIDIYPTLVEYSGENNLIPYYNTLEGRTLTSLLNGEPLRDDNFAASFWRGQRCIIKGDYKYWLWDDKEHLINIKTKEKVTNPAEHNKLKNLLDRTYKQYILKKDYYKETVKRLKSLGYLQ